MKRFEAKGGKEVNFVKVSSAVPDIRAMFIFYQKIRKFLAP